MNEDVCVCVSLRVKVGNTGNGGQEQNFLCERRRCCIFPKCVHVLKGVSGSQAKGMLLLPVSHSHTNTQ